MTLTYLGYRLAQSLSKTLPPAAAFGLAQWLSDLRWRSCARDRKAVAINRSLIEGAPVAEHSVLVRETFRNFGRYLVEFFTIHRVEHPEVQIEGLEHVRGALAHGRGAIGLTAHLGNWELCGMLLHRLGIPVTAVALPHDDPRMDRMFNRQRQRCGVGIIPLGPEATRRSLQVLRRGELLGLLGDREFSRHELRVTLCGRQVIFPRGPATLSLRSHAPTVPLFLLREGRWKLRLHCEPPIWPAMAKDAETAIRGMTQAYAGVLERYLKRYPDQWLVFQPVVGG